MKLTMTRQVARKLVSGSGRRLILAALVVSTLGVVTVAPFGGAASSNWSRVSVASISASKYEPSAIASDALGNVVVGTGQAIRRYRPTGLTDGIFGANATIAVAGLMIDDIGVQGDKVVVVGTRMISATQREVQVLRLDQSGMLDSSFGSSGRATASIPGVTTSSTRSPSRLHVDPSGNMLVAISPGPTTDTVARVLRWSPVGSRDLAFATQGVLAVNLAVIDGVMGQGSIVTSWADGSFLFDNGNGWQRYSSTGLIDLSFGVAGSLRSALPTASGEVAPWTVTDAKAVGIDDGRMMVVSLAYDTSGPSVGSHFVVTRYRANGTRDDSFGTSGMVVPNVAEGDGQTGRALLLGGVRRTGSWISISGSAISLNQGVLIRMSTDGALDQSFGVGGIVRVENSGCVDHVATGTSVTCASPVLYSDAPSSARSFHAFCGSSPSLILSTGGPTGTAACPSGELPITPPSTVPNTGPVTVPTSLPGGGTSFSPKRLLDTRPGGSTVDGAFAGTGTISSEGSIRVPVLGRGDVPSTGVGAVILNVTVVDSSEGGFATLWPSGLPRPNTSNLNFNRGAITPNLAIVGVGANGSVDLFNSAGGNHYLLDVQGWIPVGGVNPLTPARLLDTRPGSQTIDGLASGGGRIGASGVRTVSMFGRGGIPASGVAGIIANVTAVDPDGNGYASVWPSGTPQPNASNVNFVAGRTIANLAVLPVGADGSIALFNSSGSTHFIVDVLGWFPSGSFGPVAPSRILDTRAGGSTIDGIGLRGVALESTEMLNFGVLGRAGVPSSGVRFVILNVTAVDPQGSGYASLWPTGGLEPNTSNLNFSAGQTVPNLVVSAVGPSGQISLRNVGGRTHYLVDVQGWL